MSGDITLGYLTKMLKYNILAANLSGLSTQQFGSGLANSGLCGDIFKFSSNGTSPASAGANDIVVASYSMPANSLNSAGDLLDIRANGNFAATVNNKTVKIIIGATSAVVGSAVVGGTTIATTGVSAASGVGWALATQVSKYGVTNSNTQSYQQVATVIGGTHSGAGLAAALTLNEASPIIIAFTINCATTASDANLWQAFVTGYN